MPPFRGVRKDLSPSLFCIGVGGGILEKKCSIVELNVIILEIKIRLRRIFHTFLVSFYLFLNGYEKFVEKNFACGALFLLFLDFSLGNPGDIMSPPPLIVYFEFVFISFFASRLQ